MLFVFSFKRHEEVDELNEGNLDPVVTLSHPQVETFAKIGLIHADDMLDILHEVLFRERARSLYMRPFDLVFLVLAPELLECACD